MFGIIGYTATRGMFGAHTELTKVSRTGIYQVRTEPYRSVR